jgi:hypothetical protein
MLSIREKLKEFQESEAFDFLLENLRGRYIKEFESSALDDYESRERAFQKLHALRELEREIERFVNDLMIDRKRQLEG